MSSSGVSSSSDSTAAAASSTNSTNTEGQGQHGQSLDSKTLDRLFQQHIRDRGPKQLFMRFLRQRFNHEMLLFLDDVKTFNKIPSSLKKEKFERAQVLTSKYIESDGELELNLRYDTKQDMLEKVSQYKEQWREVERKDASEQRKVLLEQLEGLELLLNDLKDRTMFQLKDECFGDFLLSDFYVHRHRYLGDMHRPSKSLEQIKAQRAAEKSQAESHGANGKNGNRQHGSRTSRFSIRNLFGAFGKKNKKTEPIQEMDSNRNSNGDICTSSSGGTTVSSGRNIGNNNNSNNGNTNVGVGSGGVHGKDGKGSNNQMEKTTGRPLLSDSNKEFVPSSKPIRNRKSFFGGSSRKPSKETQSRRHSTEVLSKNGVLSKEPGSPGKAKRGSNETRK